MKKIHVKGVIISNDYKWLYDLFEIDSVTPKEIHDQLDQVHENEEIQVHINSPGGHVDAGSEIYTALKSHQGKVTIQIVGIAHSAASIVAMASDYVEISPTAQMMIHNVSGGARGDYRVLQHESEILKGYNKAIANAYILKTGLSQSELLDMMNKETWLNAQEAKEKGFVDAIMFDDEQAPKLVASASVDWMIPEPIISKLRNVIGSKQQLEEFMKFKSQTAYANQIQEPTEPPTTPDPTVSQRTRTAPLSLFEKQLSLNERKMKIENSSRTFARTR